MLEAAKSRACRSWEDASDGKLRRRALAGWAAAWSDPPAVLPHDSSREFPPRGS